MAGSHSHSYSASVGPGSSSFYPAADGAVDIWLASYNRQDTITASGFSSGVSAVGGYFFGSNNVGLSTPATEITVRATDAGGTTTELLLNPGTATFRGFVSTGGLTSLTLWVGANQGVGEVDVFPTLNDLTLAVPEPQSYALMLGGWHCWAGRPGPTSGADSHARSQETAPEGAVFHCGFRPASPMPASPAPRPPRCRRPRPT